MLTLSKPETERASRSATHSAHTNDIWRKAHGAKGLGERHSHIPGEAGGEPRAYLDTVCTDPVALRARLSATAPAPAPPESEEIDPAVRSGAATRAAASVPRLKSVG